MSLHKYKCREVVGLLGGSFNPAHAGHVCISLMAIRALALDEVWWLVSPQNPLKSVTGMAPLHWRLAQAHRMTAHCRCISVLDLEARLGTRYSVDIVSRLRQREPYRCFVWLMGADNLAQVSFWWQWPRLFHLVPVAILARYPYSLRALASVAARRFARWRVFPGQAHTLVRRQPPVWVFLPTPSHPDSATQIRAVSGIWWEQIEKEADYSADVCDSLSVQSR
ncbi:Nicotinate-nucleotide adenylyltransferase [invertebrate metagenome]|uniref:Nicotinate-nucleotide adenylyltransferase n=1 Tax=invertebrate metagenome TaxID=1711999 RepID=A0A484HA11_9ZZZZ